MEKQKWSAQRANELPLDSALGRQYAAWQQAKDDAHEKGAALGALQSEYAERDEWLTLARWGACDPSDFMRKKAEAELLRRELPYHERVADLAGLRAVTLGETFGQAYQRYLRACLARSAASWRGDKAKVSECESYIRSLTGSGDGS